MATAMFCTTGIIGSEASPLSGCTTNCTTSYPALPGHQTLRKFRNGVVGKVFQSRVSRSTQKICFSRRLKISAANDGSESKLVDNKPPPLIFKARWINKTAPTNLDTVQLIKVQFKLKYKGAFGEGVRVVGGHEALGNWSLADSTELTWSPGDIWVTPPLELPVDGIFVYKYVLCQDGDATQPLQWQTGNNQVLALSASDAPLLEVHDNWKGDPSLAFTCNPDGSNSMQAEQRLLGRVRAADKKLHEAQTTIADLSSRLKRARYEAKALREEAKIGASARLALKSQLAAERSRANNLETQVLKWKEEEARAQIRLQEAVNRVKSEAMLLQPGTSTEPQQGIPASSSSSTVKRSSKETPAAPAQAKASAPPAPKVKPPQAGSPSSPRQVEPLKAGATSAPTQPLKPKTLKEALEVQKMKAKAAEKKMAEAAKAAELAKAAKAAELAKAAKAAELAKATKAVEGAKAAEATKDEEEDSISKIIQAQVAKQKAEADAAATNSAPAAASSASMPAPPPPPAPSAATAKTTRTEVPVMPKETKPSAVPQQQAQSSPSSPSPASNEPEQSAVDVAKDVVEQMGRFFGQQARSYQKPNPARWWMKNKR